MIYTGLAKQSSSVILFSLFTRPICLFSFPLKLWLFVLPTYPCAPYDLKRMEHATWHFYFFFSFVIMRKQCNKIYPKSAKIFTLSHWFLVVIKSVDMQNIVKCAVNMLASLINLDFVVECPAWKKSLARRGAATLVCLAVLFPSLGGVLGLFTKLLWSLYSNTFLSFFFAVDILSYVI